MCLGRLFGKRSPGEVKDSLPRGTHWASGKAWVRVQASWFPQCSVPELCCLPSGKEDAKNVKLYNDWIQMCWLNPPLQLTWSGFFLLYEIEYFNLLVSFASLSIPYIQGIKVREEKSQVSKYLCCSSCFCLLEAPHRVTCSRQDPGKLCTARGQNVCVQSQGVDSYALAKFCRANAY